MSYQFIKFSTFWAFILHFFFPLVILASAKTRETQTGFQTVKSASEHIITNRNFLLEFLKTKITHSKQRNSNFSESQAGFGEHLLVPELRRLRQTEHMFETK